MAMAVKRAIVLCDAAELAADAATVDALARMQLTARRHGAEIRLVQASEDLLGLIALMGLQDVLREQPSGVDAGRQAE